MVETKFTFLDKLIQIRGYSKTDWIFTSIEKYQTFYEIDLLKYMKFALKERDGYILDIGSNIGNHSLFFGLVMNKKVICFEPNPPIFEILEHNLKINRVEHQSFKIGLGSSEGIYDIEINHKDAKNNIGAAKLYNNKDGNILVMSLDQLSKDFAYKNETIMAIKADIEGMEAEMIKGARSTLLDHKPDLFLEINDDVLMAEIETILYPIGYKKLYAYAGTPVWHFTHHSRLSNMRKFKLCLYHCMTNVKQLLGNTWRMFKSPKNKK